MAPSQAPPGTLLADDIARMWTEMARERYASRVAAREAENAGRAQRGLKPRRPIGEFRPVSSGTVLQYLTRFDDMPSPKGRMGGIRHVPWWSTDQREELAAWYAARPGQGHGTGGRQAGHPAARSGR